MRSLDINFESEESTKTSNIQIFEDFLALNGRINGRDDVKESETEGKIFVGGLAWQTTEKILSNHFGKFGAIADVTLMKDKFTGQPRGFGFIRYQDPLSVKIVLSQVYHIIDGRSVDVRHAVSKADAPGRCISSNSQAAANKIFIGGLAFNVSTVDLRVYFESFGKVLDAVVMFDRKTQRSRGFGFVTFAEEFVVNVVLNRIHELSGKQVEVKQAEPKETFRTTSISTLLDSNKKYSHSSHALKFSYPCLPIQNDSIYQMKDFNCFHSLVTTSNDVHTKSQRYDRFSDIRCPSYVQNVNMYSIGKSKSKNHDKAFVNYDMVEDNFIRPSLQHTKYMY
eukprot:CAMPEP_0171457978 /NCGR_PEP_ID=MMETSP0945-20130129/3835_1 /TAXON_ID=109269 /ORGANISM="Vaucheria litorea, Strain CCMP2940" /LENGTH=336 /DNA_ID=CAMNT_0011983683 /DNA_START=119 /DNA_END=1129 /DNA_ORIENTATION=+